MLGISACTASNQVPPTAPPTQTLIPALPTNTAVPSITPSPTGTEQPRPQDLALTMTAMVTPDETAQAFAQAEPLIQRALNDLAGRLEVTPQEIEFVRQESVTWSGEDLDCDSSGSSSSGGANNGSGGANNSSDTVPGYRLLLLADELVYEYHTDTMETVTLCLESSLYDDYPDLFLERDPVAAELVALAQQRLGRELDFPTRRISISSVRPAEWEDSSLGCPVEGQVYQPFMVPGYRIVLTVNDADYNFHTDFERIIACDNGS